MVIPVLGRGSRGLGPAEHQADALQDGQRDDVDDVGQYAVEPAGVGAAADGAVGRGAVVGGRWWGRRSGHYNLAVVRKNQ